MKTDLNMTWQQVTQYTVSAVPKGMGSDAWAWAITVEYRDEGQWAVKHHSSCLSSSGKWDYEPNPSSRTDAWKRRHRFTEEEALRLARKHAPNVCINGLFPADLIAKALVSDGPGGAE